MTLLLVALNALIYQSDLCICHSERSEESLVPQLTKGANSV
jgi:hypothetical protein